MTQVLLVEDDPAIAEPLARALGREGYTVLVQGTGQGAIGAAPEADLEPLSDYSPEKDCRTYSGDGVFFPGGPDRFFIFFPWDAHKGCITMGAGGRVRKIVVKAALEGR